MQDFTIHTLGAVGSVFIHNSNLTPYPLPPYAPPCHPESAMRLTQPLEEKLVIVFDLSEFTLQCMDYEVVKVRFSILHDSILHDTGSIYYLG